MANIIQPSFSSGEISPSLRGRVDISRYQTSLARCRNFITSPNGSVKNRPGTQYIATAKYAERVCRVVPFIFSTDQAYIWEVGHEYIRFYTDQAQIQVSETTDNGINAQTLVMLHGDGTDASTTFTDSSLTPHTITPTGTAQLDTAQVNIGTASMLFDGNSDYVSTPDFAALDLAANDFSIDCWVRRTNTALNETICARNTGGASYFYLAFEGLDLRLRDYVAGDVFNMTRTVVMSANTWNHIEASRTGNSWRIFLNGVQQGATVTAATSLTARAVGLDIGSLQAASPDYYMNGWIDEFRFQAGTGAGGHTANFTPQITAYGIATSGLIPYEIDSPYQEEDLSLLRFESSADVTYILHPDYAPRTLTRNDNDDWTLSTYSSDDGPFMPKNLTDTTLAINTVTVGTGRTLTASAALFAALQVGSLFKLTHYIEAQTVHNTFSSATNGTSIKCFLTWRLISHGTWTGRFDLEKSTDGGSTWTTLRSFSATNDNNINTFGTEDVETNDVPFLLRINVTSYTSGTLITDLTSDPFFQEGVVRITAISTNISATVTVLQEVGDTTATDSWAEGSWSDYRGYPSVARFFQDRLCFADTPSEPMTTWMTRIGNYVSFFRHSPLLDDDGISVNLPTRQLNAINGLIALRKLVAFTSASEWSIGPISGNALTPTTTEQLAQGYRGSYGLNPVIVGNEAIYVQANSKVVRNLGYQFNVDGYVGSDINITSKHLFDRYLITDMAYQQDPDSVVWMVRDDGVLLGLTYMIEQEVIGWHWHDTGGFDTVSGGTNQKDSFESIATIPGGRGYDELWCVVNRTNGRFIELMTQRMISVECGGEREIKAENQIFLDSSVTFSNQLEIENITINADGKVVVTTSTDHSLTTGDVILIDCVDGTTELNKVSYEIQTGLGLTTTLLLLHFDGADNQTSTVDSSSYGRTITRNGSVLLDDDEEVFGSASSYFPADGGTGSGGGTHFWSAPSSANFGNSFWNGSWTIELRVNFEINNQGHNYFASWLVNAFSFIQFGYMPSGGTTNGGQSVGLGRFFFTHRAGVSPNVVIQADQSFIPTVNTWYDIKLIKTGTSFKFYVDGEQLGSTQTEATTISGITTQALQIGADTSGTPNRAFQGWIDEYRISSVVQTSDVATVAFPDADNSFYLKLIGGAAIDGTAYGEYVSGGHVNTESTDFSDLDHLEGQTVGILADGVPLTQQIVTGGEITLTGHKFKVIVGLPYLSDFQTLKIDTPTKGGTIQANRVKVSNVTFRLEDSRGGVLGPDEDNLDTTFESAILDAIGDDDLAELFTGDVRVPSGGEYKNGQIFYRQRDPLPISILAIVPELDVGGPTR